MSSKNKIKRNSCQGGSGSRSGSGSGSGNGNGSGNGSGSGSEKEYNIKNVWQILIESPKNVLPIIVSKWKIGEGPEYDTKLAIWIIENAGIFPSCWNLDRYLYPLLYNKPSLAKKLILAEHNRLKITRRLRQLGEMQLGEGVESLLKAATNGEVECVRGLLSAGVDVNSKSRDGASALQLATIYNKPRCIRVILSFPNVNVNSLGRQQETALHNAVFNENEECIKILLAAPNINVNVKAGATAFTPLHIAAQYGKTRSVELLLHDDRVDINARNRWDLTPLDMAKTRNIMNRNNAVIELLEEKNTQNTQNTERAERTTGTEVGRTGGSEVIERTNIVIYKGKKYKTHIGKKGGEYILVGIEKKKVYVTNTAKKQTKQNMITEAVAQEMLQAKEERDMRLFYKLAEVEPEEETLEQKIQRQKKELVENKIR